jgi:hypothetical protein
MPKFFPFRRRTNVAAFEHPYDCLSTTTAKSPVASGDSSHNNNNSSHHHPHHNPQEQQRLEILPHREEYWTKGNNTAVTPAQFPRKAGTPPSTVAATIETGHGTTDISIDTHSSQTQNTVTFILHH